MNRHRTRRTAKEVEQDFPHFVDIAVPPSGLGSKLAAMYDFHARHRISPKRGHGRRDDRGGTIRWCFADPALADAFAQEFVRISAGFHRGGQIPKRSLRPVERCF